MAIPAMVVMKSGSFMTEEDLDIMGFVYFTLGNIGMLELDSVNGTIGCSVDADMNSCNVTHMMVMDRIYSRVRVSYMLSSMEFVSAILFFIGLAWFKGYLIRVKIEFLLFFFTFFFFFFK